MRLSTATYKSKFYGSFDEMMEYAIHFKLISEGYKKDLIKKIRNN